MIFAQLVDNVIVNTIVIEDMSTLDLFTSDPFTGVPYDAVLQIDTIYPRPGIGWIFDNIVFQPPGEDT